MCTEVCVKLPGGDEWCERFGELESALGIEPVTSDGYTIQSPDRTRCCLCPVDMQATAAKAGMTVIPPHYDETDDHYNFFYTLIPCRPASGSVTDAQDK